MKSGRMCGVVGYVNLYEHAWIGMEYYRNLRGNAMAFILKNRYLGGGAYQVSGPVTGRSPSSKPLLIHVSRPMSANW